MTNFLDWLEKRRVFIGSVATLAILGVGALLAWIDWHPPRTETVLSRSVIKQEVAPVAATTVASEVVTQPSAVKATTSSAPTQKSGKVNINSAGLSELDGLPAIGKTYAQRIIDYRTTHGNFKNVRDLVNVKGIGEATFAKIKDLVTIGGE